MTTKEVLTRWFEMVNSCDKNDRIEDVHFHLGNTEFIGEINNYGFSGTVIDHSTETAYKVTNVYPTWLSDDSAIDNPQRTFTVKFNGILI